MAANDAEEEEDMEISDNEEDGADEDDEVEDGSSDLDEDQDESEEEEVLEPKVLPNRTTRARRLGALLDEEDSADEDFWNQDFFAEEDKDEEFEASESEQEDVPDTDFSESEEDDDEDEDEVEARVRKEERSKKKVLRPPGAAARRPPPVRPKSAGKPPPAAELSPGTQRAVKAAREAEAAESLKPPQLRKSTRQRVEDAERERERNEQRRPKKRRQEVQVRALTQEELLAEAAYTELENLRSLELMQAVEEEAKKKAAVIRARHSGPVVRYHSKVVNGASLVTCEVANMLLPAHMKRQAAPPPKQPAVCAVSGRPARYRDPLTGQPYADAAAFQALRQLCPPAPATASLEALGRAQRRSTTGRKGQYGEEVWE